MGIVKAICISERKGTKKTNVGTCELVENHGLKDDAHAGSWHRQVSLLSYDKVESFRATGATVDDGAFGENLLVEGIDFRALPVGTQLSCGEVRLEITQIGKECHNDGCAIRQATGKCVMPTDGVFAVVISGGMLRAGDEIEILQAD